MKRTTYITLLTVSMLFVSAGILLAEADRSQAREGGMLPKPTLTTASPNWVVCTHNYNNLWVPVSNFGYIGSGSGGWTDCETGTSAHSAEFPYGSQCSYLYAGALWIGAVIGEDTLVSVGFNGWGYQYEMVPCDDPNECDLVKITNRPGDPAYQEDAHSDLEYYCVYTDTIRNHAQNGRDWETLASHQPLYIEISQHSYSWSVEYAEDFVLLDYQIKNVGDEALHNLYVGLYVDGDVAHTSQGREGYGDDMCGFRETVSSSAGHGYLDTINFAWIADNDGDPSGGSFDYLSPRSVAGVRVMRVPTKWAKVSFNWWTSNGNSALDWGPMLEATKRNYGTGGQGTPEGDKNKYYLMSNGEQDYDQTHSYLDFSPVGWLPPNNAVAAVANGGDTRYVISTGPFDIPAGDSLPLTLGYLAGETLHKKPDNFEMNMTTTYNPDEFYSNLSFKDAGVNAVWASWVYDNPGYDTDGDGDAGPFWEIVDTVNNKIVIDTFYYAGDGVPDFRAATAPPAPVLRYTTENGKVVIRWNGYHTETTIDPFTKVPDFEGYNVYFGRLGTKVDLSLVTSHDILNYVRFMWDTDLERWEKYELPITLNDLKSLYGESFEPEEFQCDQDGVGFYDPEDSLTFCFEELGWNQPIAGWQDGAIVTGATGYRKRFAAGIDAGDITSDWDTLNPDLWVMDFDPVLCDSVLYHKYYEYEFEMENLLQSVPWFFSVTAFDFGDFANNLDPMESSVTANVVEVWAINDCPLVENYDLQPYVYPNPYYGDGRYWQATYEDAERTGFVDHSRMIHFCNLPCKATIKIYTLSGDLVREIEHYDSCIDSASDSDWNSKVHWNMRSQHNELIASGIYLFTVESDYGHYIGKLVIIL